MHNLSKQMKVMHKQATTSTRLQCSTHSADSISHTIVHINNMPTLSAPLEDLRVPHKHDTHPEVISAPQQKVLWVKGHTACQDDVRIKS